MSNPNPSDPTPGHPEKIASNNKVIVLSMKNMVRHQHAPSGSQSIPAIPTISENYFFFLSGRRVLTCWLQFPLTNSKFSILFAQPSFKFDPSKNFLAANNSDNGQSIFNFKPQQLIQSAAPQMSTTQQKVQVVPQSSPVAVQKIGSPGTILIRAQSSPAVSKSQFTSLTNCPNVKIQDAAPAKVANVNKEAVATFRNKATNEITMKTQSGHTLLVQPLAAGKAPAVITSPLLAPSGIKGITFTPIPPALSSQFQRVGVTTKQVTVSKIPSKPIAIRPKVDSSLPPSLVIQAPQQQTKTSVISLPAGMPNFARFNAVTQKWTMPPMTAPLPALTLIQPKILKVVEVEEAEDVEEPEEVMEVHEKTPEKAKPKRTSQEERLREVKRIIEGDQDEVEEDPQEEPPADEESSHEPAELEVPSSLMLLCDEKIENVSPEVNGKSQEAPTTPAGEQSSVVDVSPSIQEVKKNLHLALSQECDKENVDILMDEDSLSDDSEIQRQKLPDYEESLTRSEISKSSDQITPTAAFDSKPKRVRKAKNPTIIATLGLPYKPSQPSNRKSKVEKKLEFELDFHDPLNKIQWDDGIGGLNNCNKLFGFDEFGLIEVINKKDVMAKLKQLDAKEPSDDGAKFNLRRIVDPADLYVCSVCSKHGSIRDFFSPECCSEACLAITKRKAGELNASGARESSSESGVTTPVDERKMMFGGEMIPLQQLQQHLLEQQMPPSKRPRTKKRAVMSTVPETRFQWDTYLTAKSVPAPVELFKNPYPRTPNPFRVGMKLEAIDPENQKLFCVCTVEEKLGYRIKLHFDGYPPAYDFWVNADSPNIFPTSFCQSTNRALQTPPKWSSKKFDWSEYLDFTDSSGAQRVTFPHMSKTYDDNPFQVGMKLEVTRDGKLYAASIMDVLQNRVLIGLDGHEALGCAWMEIHSPYLHPCNYHKTVADPEVFAPPFPPFVWKDYLKETDSQEAPSEFLFFRTRSAFDFEPGLKLEVVDRVNRQLIRPATVLCRDEYKVQVIFDGFDISFACWFDDDSEDMHPINWCEKTGHPIEHPAGFNKSLDNGLCPTAGCRGIGNGVHTDRYFHDNVEECPYMKTNWTKLLNRKLGSRIDSKGHVRR